VFVLGSEIACDRTGQVIGDAGAAKYVLRRSRFNGGALRFDEFQIYRYAGEGCGEGAKVAVSPARSMQAPEPLGETFLTLSEGHTWESDPAGNLMATAGRTVHRWVRSNQDKSVCAMFKSPPVDSGREIYSIGMEAVTYQLGRMLDLPIPETILATIDGVDGALVELARGQRDWQTADAAPMLKSHINNLDCFPVGVAFDIWIANLDRKAQHLLVQPLPVGARAAVAQEARVLLIDHGVSGLWFPSKFADGLTVHDTEKVDVGDGSLLDLHEAAGRKRMPAEYRRAFTDLEDAERDRVLDAVREISDDAIEGVLEAVPAAYMTEIEIEKTFALLKTRRDRIDTLSEGHW
jgi:hypothetical protein